GEGEERRRYLDRECFRCRNVDDEIELGRLLHREIGRLRAFEYFVHVGSDAPIQVSDVWSIGDEAPSIEILLIWEHRRQSVLCRQVQQASSLTEQRVG